MWEEILLHQLRSRYAPRRRGRQDSGTSKASKRARKTPVPADDYADPDRISSLPDTVLRHILSFLDTKYAVATSVLSTRWKDVCISLPNVVLDDSLTFKKRKKDFEKSFEKFACRQIVLRNVPIINKFRLKCNFIEDSTMSNILCAALCCKAKEIDLWIGDSTTAGILPLELFTCRSLVVLKLRAAVELFVWECVDLPKLKVMQLVDFMLDGDSSMRRLFKGCENLEELCLSRCSFGNNKVLHLSFPLLRKLSIDGDSNFMDFLEDRKSKCKLVMDTPSLEFFEYHGNENEFHLVKNLSSLVRAKISFITKVKNWENVAGLIDKMRGVKSLYLSDSALEAVYSNGSTLPVFENLAFLELSAFDLRILPSILETAPQLEELVINEHGYDDEAGVVYTLPEAVAMCLTVHLRNVEFKKFIGTEHDFELVKYLLQNGKVLKRLKIAGLGRPTSDLSTSTCKKISMFPKCSKTIEIMFEYDQDLEGLPC